MHIPQGSSRSLVQTWFVGSHSDLGRDIDGLGLIDYPLAAMLQQIQNAIPDFPFNHQALEDRFPEYSADSSPEDDESTGSSPFVPNKIKHTNTGLIKLMGTSGRTPGHYLVPGYVTNETICPSVRMREEAIHQSVVSAVPGFQLQRDDGTVLWVSGVDNHLTLPEAESGPFMAKLLGWPRVGP
jgi:hypothetical protein